jgi:hypothetical protein
VARDGIYLFRRLARFLENDDNGGGSGGDV